ncbi:MAG TPA: dihydrofolate reductase family protein [Stellaceae bacterium]|nr:dihydrofolate reductase family protein [Stellaceae bacterium]
MRRLVMKMSISADGFVGGSNGEIDWLFRSADEGTTGWVVDTVWRAGLHIMGSRTFQDMVAYWPGSTEVFAQPMNEIPKAVFTRQKDFRIDPAHSTTALREARDFRGIKQPDTPPELGNWREAEIVTGDLASEIARLKSQPGKDILAHGGAGFMRSLVALDLVDEYRLLVHPVVLGRGLGIFSDIAAPRPLELVETAVFKSGAVATVYRRAS